MLFAKHLPIYSGLNVFPMEWLGLLSEVHSTKIVAIATGDCFTKDLRHHKMVYPWYQFVIWIYRQVSNIRRTLVGN